MTIKEMLDDIDVIDNNLVVFVQYPIQMNSEIILYDEDSSENKSTPYGWEYFLEISIIKELIELMEKNIKNINRKIIFEGIEYYAKNDAYPLWMLG